MIINFCFSGNGGGGEGAGVSSINGKSGTVNLANINGFDLTEESAIGVYTGVWSGDKHYLAKENGQQGGMFLATINGQSIITDKDTPLDIKVEGSSKPTFNLSINDEWTALVNDDQLQGLINYIKENGVNSVKDVDVKVSFSTEADGDVYVPNEIFAASDTINITISFGDGVNYINVDYDGNTTSFTTTTLVATNPNEHSILQILQMSQDEYDALEEKEDNTLYIIRD